MEAEFRLSFRRGAMADLGYGVQPEPRRPPRYIPVRPPRSGCRTAAAVLLFVVCVGLCGLGVLVWR